MNDLRFALRQLRKSPGFTVAAVVTLGVGIGINVAVYSITHAVLLSALPFPEADRLVAVSEACELFPRFQSSSDARSRIL